MTPKKKAPKQDVKKIRELINLNPDSRQYFYAKADERWLDWLWGNNFLDVIKQKDEDPTRYGYKTPELNYLVKVAEKEPVKVADIMLSVPLSAETFNPEVVDRFLRICSELPAQELKRIVKKIRDEVWPQLMGAFSDWGFEYEKMLQTLTKAKDFDNVLTLTEAILSVRTKEEMEATSSRLPFDNHFYFKDLSYTKVFDYLRMVDEKYMERGLALVTETMGKIASMKEKESDNEVFDFDETLHLFDVDFFTLELNDGDRLSHDDVKNLAAVIKQYAKRTIGGQCSRVKLVTKLYNTYFKSLPNSRCMWRLRLFVISLCPKAFKGELKKAFFRLFEVERYHELLSGTEYEKALGAGFPVLSEKDKRKYVTQVYEYFNKQTQSDKEVQKWHKMYGSNILSMIADELTKSEKQKAEKDGFKLEPGYEPEPSIGKVRTGIVVPRGPITKEDFGNLSINDIARKLQTEWIPEKLREQNKSDDFLNPINAEGVGEFLQQDISHRLQDYINNAKQFFERDVLDPHYTYSFLYGIQEVIRGNKANISITNWDSLIAFCITIKESGEAISFDHERRANGAFYEGLSDWTGVHSAISNVFKELLSDESRGVIIDFPKHRDDIFAVLSYLLAYPDPEPKDEQIESAGRKTKSANSDEWLVSDPYSIAINTVRGRAFQAFVLFIYQDGQKIPKVENVKISSDVKKLYENILKKEQTRALMFMFGHYLSSFYFRDREWIQGLLPQIFSSEQEKKHLYTSAWEGYVSASLYEEIFFNNDIQKLYKRGLALTDVDYPNQKHFKEPNEGVAVHLALAFMHFSKFGFGHDLFKEFWLTQKSEYHKEFISFIGRHSISRESPAEWIKNNKLDIEKLKKFWGWALENCNADVLIGFGSWINIECGAFDTKWLAQYARKTLEKTKGYVAWEYGLMRSLSVFAKEAQEDTLAILRFHLFEEVAKQEPPRSWLHTDSEVYDAFRELYKNKKTKEGVRTLINDLLPYRDGLFWRLKSILEEDNIQK